MSLARQVLNRFCNISIVPTSSHNTCFTRKLNLRMRYCFVTFVTKPICIGTSDASVCWGGGAVKSRLNCFSAVLTPEKQQHYVLVNTGSVSQMVGRQTPYEQLTLDGSACGRTGCVFMQLGHVTLYKKTKNALKLKTLQVNGILCRIICSSVFNNLSILST